MTSPPPIPQKPDLVLRVGFAGNRLLPDDTKVLCDALDIVFGAISRSLVDIRYCHDSKEASSESWRVVNYYSRNAPVFRLVTGVAEGADALAIDALDRIDANKVRPELGAIVPFNIAQYRAQRNEEFHSTFDKMIQKCSYVLQLDGYSERDEAHRQFRARSFRAQSAMLLRHSDILVVIINPDREGRAGGTLETIRSALALDIPVVYIHSETGNVRVLGPAVDLHSALVGEEDGRIDIPWEEQLQKYISDIVADPDTNPPAPPSEEHKTIIKSYRGDQILEELFSERKLSKKLDFINGIPKHKKTFREKLWSLLERRFRDSTGPQAVSDKPVAPYAVFYNTARELNYYYTGLYRGTFFLNYVLAIVAVTLAALTLIVLGKTHTSTADQFKHFVPPTVVKDAKSSNSPAAKKQTDEKQAASKRSNSPASSETGKTSEPQHGTSSDKEHNEEEQNDKEQNDKPHKISPYYWLLLLGGLKFGVVYIIYRNTHAANHEEWNFRAVDYRYLVERLRTMNYLSRIGSFQPPVANPLQFASRAVRQSSIDWLFDAIVRSISPAEFATATNIEVEPGKTVDVKLIKPDARAVLHDVQEKWLVGQVKYHERNSRTLGRLHAFIDRWGKRLSTIVMWIVIVDVVMLIGELSHILPNLISENFHIAAPYMIFTATVLPAIVASLNGINFQSECYRLAERSAVMRVILGGKPNTPIIGGRLQDAKALSKRIDIVSQARETDPCAWSVEVLHLSEKIAIDLVQEVAEWSVLYAKEVVEA